VHTGFRWEHLSIAGRVILKWIIKKWDGGGGIDLVAVVQDRGQ
jgi:hypothetical protein